MGMNAYSLYRTRDMNFKYFREIFDMAVTDVLRSVLQESRQTHYQVGKSTGVDIRIVDRFVSGETVPSGTTIDKLCKYFGLELAEKKQKKSAKKATKRRRKTVPPPKTRP